MTVPFVDLAALVRSGKAEYLAAFERVLDSGGFVGGPAVTTFEAAFASYCGAPHAVAVRTGTDALVLALRALGVGPGDEVITAANSFFATAEAISHAGATPVLADADDAALLLDPADAARRVTRRTRCIIPVHLFGQIADMAPIRALAAANRLHVLEDAAQAHGATRTGPGGERWRAGSIAAIAAFSFYPTKNLGALGDAGLVTTDDPALDKRLRSLRVHGSEVKYYHKEIGYNMRLDAIHAAMLRVKLPHVPNWLTSRQEAARRYDKLIESANLNGFIRRPIAKPDRRHTYNQYVVRVPAPHRDALVKHLKTSGIGIEVYYPLSLHEQECFKFLGHRTGDFPVGEAAAAGVLALPMFPEITAAQQERVIEVCVAYLSQSLRKAA